MAQYPSCAYEDNYSANNQRSAMSSAAIMTGKWVLARGNIGKIEASHTRKDSTPITRPEVSTTVCS